MTEPGWISLKCSWCQTKFRIKEAYAHLKGKCPECGTRVLPVKHKPHEPLPALSDAEEPMGLVPLDDDEWPEPAQREREDVEVAGLQYGFAAAAQVAATEPTTPAPGTVFGFAAEKPAAPPPPPVPTSQGAEDTFQPAPPKKEKPAPPPPKQEAPPPPPPKKETPPPPPTPAMDPLFLDEMPALAAAPAPPPAPPAPKAVAPPAPPNEDVVALADAQKAAEPPDDGPVISPYSFKDGEPAPLPPAPPPLAKFPPADYVPPADGDKQAKSKRKKEKATETTDKNDPHASSNETSKDADSYRLTQAELNPERAVPPPDQLFIFGVWDWPFHPINLKALIAIVIGTAAFLFFLAEAIDQFANNSSALGFVFGSALVFLSIIVFGFAGSYASAWFLAILNDTANGSREVIFPGGGIVEWMGALLRVVWIAFLSGLITIPLGVLWGPLWGLAGMMLFPVFLLCSLASEWSWSPWHPDVAWNIARKLKLYFTMNFLAALLWVIVGTVFWATFSSKWLFAALGGLAFAIAWLIYARLLGRFGWVVLNPDEEPQRKKKKKKKKKKTDEDDGESEEETSVEGTASSSLVAADKS